MTEAENFAIEALGHLVEMIEDTPQEKIDGLWIDNLMNRVCEIRDEVRRLAK